MTAEPLDRGLARVSDVENKNPWVPPVTSHGLRLIRQPEGSARADHLAGSTQPTLHRWALRYLQAVVEIVEGDRSPSQLLRGTAPDVYTDVVSRACARARSQHSGRTNRQIRAHVASVKVFEPRPGAAEVSAHVRYGVRSHALAARFELVTERWICTVLDWG